MICRLERPHPGAQHEIFDIDGHRFQAFLTDTPRSGNDINRLELRHRQHARVEDRIRNTKDRGMRNLPCQDWHTNAAWLELALTANDLSVWAQALCFTGVRSTDSAPPPGRADSTHPISPPTRTSENQPAGDHRALAMPTPRTSTVCPSHLD